MSFGQISSFITFQRKDLALHVNHVANKERKLYLRAYFQVSVGQTLLWNSDFHHSRRRNQYTETMKIVNKQRLFDTPGIKHETVSIKI